MMLPLVQAVGCPTSLEQRLAWVPLVGRLTAGDAGLTADEGPNYLY